MTSAYTLRQAEPLAARNTFGIAATADWLATVHARTALPAALADKRVAGLPVLVLGDGSNVLFATDRYAGMVLQLACADVQVIEDSGHHALVRAEAGLGWDALVEWTLERGLCGLENLALIPGRVGAAPIQNIGAYGAELASFVRTVEAYDTQLGSSRRLDAADCAFGYRDSVFKHERDRYTVTAVELELRRDRPCDLSYAGLAEELVAMGDLAPTPRHVAAAVRRIRRRKLPDPSVIGNAGSFFKNPIVPAALAMELQARWPQMPIYAGASSDSRKLSAAWLIERAGWRGHREGDAGVAPGHALVLVNHGAATGAQLLGLAHRVAESVAAQSGVRLEPEPRIVGAEF